MDESRFYNYVTLETIASVTHLFAYYENYLEMDNDFKARMNKDGANKEARKIYKEKTEIQVIEIGMMGQNKEKIKE